MTIRVQLIIGILVAVMLMNIIHKIIQKKIDLRYSLRWFALCVVILIIDVFPDTLEWMARLSGIQLPSNMIFFVAIVLLSLTVFSLTAAVSRLSEKNMRLIQEVAILRNEVENLKKTDE